MGTIPRKKKQKTTFLGVFEAKEGKLSVRSPPKPPKKYRRTKRAAKTRYEQVKDKYDGIIAKQQQKVKRIEAQVRKRTAHEKKVTASLKKRVAKKREKDFAKVHYEVTKKVFEDKVKKLRHAHDRKVQKLEKKVERLKQKKSRRLFGFVPAPVEPVEIREPYVAAEEGDVGKVIDALGARKSGDDLDFLVPSGTTRSRLEELRSREGKLKKKWENMYEQETELHKPYPMHALEKEPEHKVEIPDASWLYEHEVKDANEIKEAISSVAYHKGDAGKIERWLRQVRLAVEMKNSGDARDAYVAAMKIYVELTKDEQEKVYGELQQAYKLRQSLKIA